MNEILSRENYISFAAQLVHVSDAENLLNFMPQWLHSLSNQDAATVDINRRASRFMLAVISRMHNVPLSNIPYDPDSYAFPLLLTVLGNKKVRNISNRDEVFLRANIARICLCEQNDDPPCERDSIQGELHHPRLTGESILGRHEFVGIINAYARLPFTNSRYRHETTGTTICVGSYHKDVR